MSHMKTPTQIDLSAASANWASWCVRLCFVSLLLPTLLFAQEATRQPDPPLVTVAVHSLDRLAEQIDRFPIDAAARGPLTLLSSLQGVDRTRPIGLFLYPNAEDHDRPHLMLSLPLNSINALQRSVNASRLLRLEAGAAAGEWELETPQQNFVGRLEENRLLLAAESRFLNHSDLLTTTLFELSHGDQAVAIRIDLNGAPPAMREQALSDFHRDLRKEKAPKENEPEHERRIRLILTGLIEKLGDRVIQGTERLEVRASAADGVLLDVDWYAIPDAGLAEDFSQLPLTSATFWTSAGRSAFKLRIAAHMPDWVSAELQRIVQEVREQVEREWLHSLPDDMAQSTVGIFGSLQATFASGEFEGSVSFAPVSEQAMAFVSGFSVLQGDQMQGFLRTVLPYVAQKSGAELSLDWPIDGQWTWHQLPRTKVKPREERLYGPGSSVLFGTSPDSFVIAVGGPETSAMLANSGVETLELPSVVEGELALAGWVDLALQTRPNSAILQILKDRIDSGDSFDVTFRVEAFGNRLNGRLHAAEGYLKLLEDYAGIAN